MFALLRLIGRRFAKKRVGNSTWLRRTLIVVAVVRWIIRLLDRPQVVRLRKGETATVSVSQQGSRES
jgi:hypothetical protein